MEHVQTQMRELKQRAEVDKEALKKATRALKQRAERSEDTAGHLSAQLTEMVRTMRDLIWSLQYVYSPKIPGPLRILAIV